MQTLSWQLIKQSSNRFMNQAITDPVSQTVKLSTNELSSQPAIKQQPENTQSIQLINDQATDNQLHTCISNGGPDRRGCPDGKHLGQEGGRAVTSR